MPEAMRKVRGELGENAVIINSKTILTGGVLGLFKKKNIEVIAAVDPTAVETSKQANSQATKLTPQSKPKEGTESIKDNQQLKSLLVEIQQLKNEIHRSNAEAVIVPDPLKPIVEKLIDQGVAPSLINQWAHLLTDEYFTQDKPQSFEENIELFDQTILSKKQELLTGTNLLEKKYIALVGPTGVGKTTTLAKLAAKTILQDKRKVAFITTDTFRIAAIEQLKTYANIVGAPIEVCYNIEDFKRAKDRFHQYDTIFIDTAGRNFRNPQYVEDLKEVIDFKEDVQTFLTLSLTAKEKDIKQIIEQFSLLHIDRFIFTKLDETSQYGTIVNLVWEKGIGVGYVTDGQNVPDDLKEASKELILSYLVGDVDQYGSGSHS